MSNRYQNSSRERSRERHHGYRGRSDSSQDSYEKRKRIDRNDRRPDHYKTAQPPQQKRVKFNQTPDVKVFRKEDEPASKGLSEVQVVELMNKLESERGANSFSNMNWDNMKHYDAQLESNSIRQEKEREKVLHEKLMAAKQQMSYYAPLPMVCLGTTGSQGAASTEREALTARLNDVLGCFYVHQSQIPAEPAFQIQNTSTSSQPKNISFNKLIIHSNRDQEIKKTTKDQKPLKGILKVTAQPQTTTPQPKKLDPKLVQLIQEIYSKQSNYSKQQIQTLLGPYKQTGELAYIFGNKDILQSIIKSTPTPSPAPQQQRQPSPYSTQNPTRTAMYPSPPPNFPNPHRNSSSIDRGNRGSYDNPYRHSPSPNMNRRSPADPYGHYPQYGGYGYPGAANYPNNSNNFSNNPQPYKYPNQPQPGGQGNYPMGGYPQPMMVNRNYKTVPCKYYHSSQGCVKGEGCTFIHNQQYAGHPTPDMMKTNRGMMPPYGMPHDSSMGGYMGYPPPHN